MKQVLPGCLELLLAQDPWERKESPGTQGAQGQKGRQVPKVTQEYQASQALQASRLRG